MRIMVAAISITPYLGWEFYLVSFEFLIYTGNTESEMGRETMGAFFVFHFTLSCSVLAILCQILLEHVTLCLTWCDKTVRSNAKNSKPVYLNIPALPLSDHFKSLIGIILADSSHCSLGLAVIEIHSSVLHFCDFFFWEFNFRM